MPAVADEDDAVAVADETQNLEMYFSYQRAGGIDFNELALFGLPAHVRRNSMRAVYNQTALRHFADVFDERHAARAKIVDHVLIVHDFMKHVNRRALELEHLI